MARKNSLVVVLGPTAIGKTRLAIDLALEFNTEIISADSRQIYRELNIGTASPDEDELARVKHHLVGHCSVRDYFNASKFEEVVLDLLDRLFLDHNVVIMAGGSGLYIDAVMHGIDELPSIDMEVRKVLKEKYEAEGLEGLRRMLKKLDPEHYSKVDLKNPNRILKALEISVMTGKPYSSFLLHTRKKRRFNIVTIGLEMEREQLYNRINKRADRMVEMGLVEEVKRLESYRGENALKTVGYKEIFAYMDGKYSLDEAIQKIKSNTRNYARKQITWFRRYPGVKWFHPDRTIDIIDYISENV